jgi:hypothetical protein
MSETDGNGTPLRAALKAAKQRRRRAALAALARIAATDFEGRVAIENDERFSSADEDHDEREEE